MKATSSFVKFINESSLEEWSLARNPNTDPQILDELSTSQYLSVKHVVASNPNTRPETIGKLFASFGSDIHLGIADNPSAPVQILITMLTQGLEEGRDILLNVLAKNPSLPEEALTLLRDYDSSEVRCAVASNPNTGLGDLLELALDSNRTVKKAAAANPKLVDLSGYLD